MLTVAHVLNFVLMILLPIGLGFFLARRFHVSWRLFYVGAVTFILSQIVHIPLNIGLTALFARGFLPGPPPEWRLAFNATMLGLSAGVAEEAARYLVLRYWQKTARSWSAALMFGAGHGGLEAVLVGLATAAAFVQLTALRTTDLSTLPLTSDQLATLQTQLSTYWTAPWPAALLGAAERVFALAMHLSLSVLVMQAFTRRSKLWLIAAILWHALADGVLVYLAGSLGAAGPAVGPALTAIYWTEAAAGVIALISLGIIFALRRPDPPIVVLSEPADPPTSSAPRTIDPAALTAEALEETKYQ